jgi:anti-anti-sigma factor
MQQLYLAVDDEQVTNVIVDLRNTSYFGSDFIGVLLKVWRRVRSRDGRFAICNMTEGENDILSICELDKLWKIYPTLEEAKASVGI